MKKRRSIEYLNFVRSHTCVVCGARGVDAHHLIGHGQHGMNSKASDFLAIPMCRNHHSELHNQGWRNWEDLYGSQWRYVAAMLLSYIDEKIPPKN